MDEETPWILKMLSERKINARSAGRILRALDLLNETEKRQAMGDETIPQLGEEQADEAESSQESQQLSPVGDGAQAPDQDETAIWEEVEEVARDMREAEAHLQVRLLEIEMERERSISQETILPVEEIETAEPDQEEKTVLLSETEGQVDEAEELLDVVASSDAELLAEEPVAVQEIQSPQSSIEELVEAEEVSLESTAEEEPPSQEPLADIDEEKSPIAQEIETAMDEESVPEEEPPSQEPLADIDEEESPIAQETETVMDEESVSEEEPPWQKPLADIDEEESPIAQETETVIDEESVSEKEPTLQESSTAFAEEKSTISQETEVEKETGSLVAGEPALEEDSLTVIAEEEPLLAQGAKVSEKIEPRFAEEPIAGDVVWTEISDKLTEDDGACAIVGIPKGIGIMLEKSAGDITIQSWDQPHVRVEGDEDSFTVLQAENILKIKSEGNIALYMPQSIGKISANNDSGSIDIDSYPNDIFVDSNSGDVRIKGAYGSVRVTNIEGNITLEECRNKASLESLSGDIRVRSALNLNIENEKVGIDLRGEGLGSLLKGESGSNGITLDNVLQLNMETDSGNIELADINADVSVKSNSGKITAERCRGQSINVESNGGSIDLRDIANDMDLKSEGGDILVEDFLGKINVRSKDADIFIRKSGDTEIRIESDGGNIEIEDCYADAYVNSGTGDVHISGGNLSFGGMGKVDLKIESGDAYLRRRTFEDVRIAIGNGNAELNMEKLNLGGSGRISVYRGDITIRVSPSFKCEMTAHALRKRIHMDLPIKIMEKDKNQMRGMLNGGGSKVELIAPDGEIRLQAL